MAASKMKVLDLIREAQKQLPVDVIGICNDLGIKVFAVGKWESNQSGMIKRTDTGEYEIYVNKSHSDERNRFTIAHELAHWILHRNHIGDGILDDALYRSGLPSRLETEANRLAASILMPRSAVDREWADPECDVTCMAGKFQVSKQAMAIRLGLPGH